MKQLMIATAHTGSSHLPLILPFFHIEQVSCFLSSQQTQYPSNDVSLSLLDGLGMTQQATSSPLPL